MDPELHLLYQSQLCLLLAVRELVCGQIIQNGHSVRANLTLSRLDAQIELLRHKGVSLDELQPRPVAPPEMMIR